MFHYAMEQNHFYAFVARRKGIMKVFEGFTNSNTVVLLSISQNI